jgi:AmiR/NasT family two-component response regulator
MWRGPDYLYAGILVAEAQMPAKCILLVDDSAIVRHGVRHMFEAHGYLICGEAENGKEAIEQAEKLHPDLIVLEPCDACDERT